VDFIETKPSVRTETARFFMTVIGDFSNGLQGVEETQK